MEINVKKVLLVMAIIFMISLLFLASGFYILVKSFVDSENKAKDSLAVINISGAIVGGEGGGAFGSMEATSDQIMAHINEAKDDESVKGILLRVNSPGGSSAASDAIYRELKKFRETGKPIVVSMGDAAASGGYYVSMAANKIYANPSTITGSIGVIMQFANLKELYNKIGIDYITIKSRKYKDLGNPDREMTAEEKEILQTMVKGVYQQFVDAVMEGRSMTEDRVKELADGRIYSGEQAKELGLVDELGTFYDAVDELAKMVGIEGKPNLIYYNKLSPIELLLGNFNKSLIKGLVNNLSIQTDNIKDKDLGFYYY
ncbi:signal peptide peptidase A [Orenia metallireducens]|jgi:protease-4|uniref:Signal peptide peptidase A. Serine peptidase. MEROPS family S49 n=1 Tax=Orenia metallireducens TaxID=1413210 RepID=A0A285GYE6_9FIRM|nr:signal peptide peptidase SppA [Orenia metallireducens]PRX26421.1 signal peptide peptidase A [Orenia metallireducens]SNY28505.1 signal peptide peptidase A. Serine peptidase. MEROPS family S49 [Orenia metallireducens]